MLGRYIQTFNHNLIFLHLHILKPSSFTQQFYNIKCILQTKISSSKSYSSYFLPSRDLHEPFLFLRQCSPQNSQCWMLRQIHISRSRIFTNKYIQNTCPAKLHTKPINWLERYFCRFRLKLLHFYSENREFMGGLGE